MNYSNAQLALHSNRKNCKYIVNKPKTSNNKVDPTNTSVWFGFIQRTH